MRDCVKKQKNFNWDKELLIREAPTHTQIELAKMCNVSVATVSTFLRKNGIPFKRLNKRKNATSELYNLNDDELPLDVIKYELMLFEYGYNYFTRKYGVSREKMEHFINNAIDWTSNNGYKCYPVDHKFNVEE